MIPAWEKGMGCLLGKRKVLGRRKRAGVPQTGLERSPGPSVSPRVVAGSWKGAEDLLRESGAEPGVLGQRSAAFPRFLERGVCGPREELSSPQFPEEGNRVVKGAWGA